MAFRHAPRHSLSELSNLSTLSELSTLSQASLTSFSPTDMISGLPYTSPIPTGPYTNEPFTSPFPSATATGVPTSTAGSGSQSSGDLGSAPTLAFASLTTVLSVTLTLPSTTIVTTTFSEIPISAPAPSSITIDPVCAGRGIDAAATGVIASLVLTAAVGIFIWLFFAVIRPRVPALYAAREWFVRPNLRPPPLRSTFWAFLFPPVPLVPDLSSHAPFPSDGQLAQRTLWVAFLLVLGWTIVGLVGALPLYLVDTPCLGDYSPRTAFRGRVSTLQDLSLLRLLKLYDEGAVSTTYSPGLERRAIVDGNDRTPAARTRLIILTVFVIVLFAFPALFKLLREWTNVLACRQRWLEELHSADIVWLRADRAPGFQGWGEGRVKDLLVRCGLTSKLGGEGNTSRSTGSRSASTRSPGPMRSFGGSGDDHARRNLDGEVGRAQGEGGEVDVHGIFTVVDTSRLEELIRERATVLENLEVAESYYIRSFQLSTSSPGSDEETSESEGRHSGPRISRPLPLGGRRRDRINQLGPGEHGGPTPTSYVAPSQYYKLRNVNGINGGRITSSNDSLAFRISQRVIGSRFQEVTRESVSFGHLPLGSRVRVGQTGELAAVPPTPAVHGAFPSTTGSESLGAFGPNYPPVEEEAWEMTDVQSDGGFARTRRGISWLSSTVVGSGTGGPSKAATVRESVASPKPIRKARESTDPYARRETLDTFGRRDTSDEYRRRATVDSRREPEVTAPTPTPGRTSAARRRSGDHSSTHRQPVLRPVSGLDNGTLTLVYDGIRTWRSRLKALNAEIAEAQQEAYTAIAEGRHVKGWLLVGRNVRYLAGTESIEGRSKSDVRWHELQRGRDGPWSDLRYWAVVALVAVLLTGTLIPVVGLALAGAPDVARYLPFLTRLSGRNDLGASIATTVAPALAATLFIILALLMVNRAARFSGPASVSGERLRSFKAIFYVLTFVATAWIIAAGALIFGVEAFANRSQRSMTVADGTTYIVVLLMVIILNAAVIAPGFQILQPVRLWRMYRAKRKAITPRQRFRAIYPGSFNPTYASGCCVLAVIFASTFSLIFPLIGPPIVLLALLSLIAHRYLVGYVWSQTDTPSTGGVLQLWILRRFATLLALQPILLGLILLSRRLWALAGVLFGAALVIILIVEGYCGYKSRNPPERKFSPVVRDSLATFRRSVQGSRSKRRLTMDEDGTSLVSSPMERGGVPRGSIASVLDMMSITLNVMPSPNRPKDAVPIETEDIDDLVSTERAAHTYPGAAPTIPSTDHAIETAGLLYPPELLAPPPMVWLPNDRSGIARSEAYDLGRYHDLETVLDPGEEGSSIGRRSNERTPTPKH